MAFGDDFTLISGRMVALMELGVKATYLGFYSHASWATFSEAGGVQSLSAKVDNQQIGTGVIESPGPLLGFWDDLG